MLRRSCIEAVEKARDELQATVPDGGAALAEARSRLLRWRARADPEQGAADAKLATAIAAADLSDPAALDRIAAALDPDLTVLGAETDWAAKWPEREWLIEGWMPVGRVGLVSGRGGRGKTRLALQVAARIGSARGSVPIPPVHGEAAAVNGLGVVNPDLCGPVVYASWEDELPEIGRRLAAMGDAGLVDVKELTDKSGLRFLDLRGSGPLWAPAAGGHVATTASLTRTGADVRATCEKTGARLLILDSAAAAFSGDENSRSLVRAFVAHFDAWASKTNCTVAIIGHQSKSGGAGGSGEDGDYSGSSDWHNSARWRWSLGPADTGHIRFRRGKEVSVEAPCLKLAKSNYGPNGARVFLAPAGGGGGGWRAVLPRSAAQAEAAANGYALHPVPAEAEAEAYGEHSIA